MSLPLPPSKMRFGVAGRRDDDAYVASALREVESISLGGDIGPSSAVLDIGCGQGRLLQGLTRQFGGVERYVGVDVHGPSISWLKDNLEPLLDYASFYRIDARNDRYNPSGKAALELPVDEKFDVIVLLSVFTHMMSDDVRTYFGLLVPRLKSDGFICLTVFVEDNVRDEEENPPDYLHGQWKRPLHCVRFERKYFEGLAEAAGLRVAHVERGRAGGKTFYYFRHA